MLTLCEHTNLRKNIKMSDNNFPFCLFAELFIDSNLLKCVNSAIGKEHGVTAEIFLIFVQPSELRIRCINKTLIEKNILERKKKSHLLHLLSWYWAGRVEDEIQVLSPSSSEQVNGFGYRPVWGRGTYYFLLT